MKILAITPSPDKTLFVQAVDGRIGLFDVKPYLNDQAFTPLQDNAEFSRIFNRSYYVEWACGADLSADTIEARWIEQPHTVSPNLAA